MYNEAPFLLVRYYYDKQLKLVFVRFRYNNFALLKVAVDDMKEAFSSRSWHKKSMMWTLSGTTGTEFRKWERDIKKKLHEHDIEFNQAINLRNL